MITWLSGEWLSGDNKIKGDTAIGFYLPYQIKTYQAFQY